MASSDLVALAASLLARLGSAVRLADMTAAPATTALAPAAADEVSALIAALFDDHASQYQVLSRELGGLHQQFVQSANVAAEA
ncbi:PE family protein [Mycobacterium sp. TY814]|uniref:PE family protein n=1 Tax=unclassified Mycobacterium TaxID=2642494 RepID=UPI00274095FF|nr:PE family protein [Mycobacterium sp. TY814]MDP7724310.1 PE family protein [Mycobacterium sp. TY814]